MVGGSHSARKKLVGYVELWCGDGRKVATSCVREVTFMHRRTSYNLLSTCLVSPEKRKDAGQQEEEQGRQQGQERTRSEQCRQQG